MILRMGLIFWMAVLFSGMRIHAEVCESSYRLYVIDCGRIVNRSAFLHTGNLKDLLRRVQKINTCFLIQKGDIEFLWDAGIPDEVQQLPDGESKFAGLFKFSLEKTLQSSLAELGLAPEDVEFVALSHMHYDHAGNLELFMNAEILVNRRELRAAFSEQPQKYHLDPSLYDEISLDRFRAIDGDYDVFGDGHLIIKAAPGHTPGHQILAMNILTLGKVVLSGDLYSSAEARQKRQIPLFNSDKALTRNTMEWFEEFVSETGAQVWVQHELVTFKRIKMAPDFYCIGRN